MNFISNITIETWANDIITGVATILASLISLYISILTLNRQSKIERKEKEKIEHINQETVIERIDFSMASLEYMSMFVNNDLDKKDIKTFIIEVKKFRLLTLS